MLSKKKLAAAALTASLVGGGAVGLYSPVAAFAQSTATTVAQADATPTWMSDALTKLVGAGTVTQAQADAVQQALTDARPDRGPGFGKHMGPRGSDGPRRRCHGYRYQRR